VRLDPLHDALEVAGAIAARQIGEGGSIVRPVTSVRQAQRQQRHDARAGHAREVEHAAVRDAR
jgi:hypothetical protein